LKTDEQGNKQEPFEQLIINVDDNLSGTIIETVANRKGMMVGMSAENGLTTIEFEIPTRGLLGFRSEFILLTK
jgi:GTP-binding protein